MTLRVIYFTKTLLNLHSYIDMLLKSLNFKIIIIKKKSLFRMLLLNRMFQLLKILQ